ncbi:MAG: DUF4276 family protein [Pirellulales bacterium]
MSVEHIEVLVEEPSMEAALRLILPKVLKTTSFEVYPFQCKNELLDRLPQRLRGYANWLPSTWRVVVIVDRDDDDCEALKTRLEEMTERAGLRTRSHAIGKRYSVVHRLAIEELEAWYFGDWQAVLAAYPRVVRTVPAQAQYRDPDAIRGGTWEAFERVLQRAGYFAGGLRKTEAARSITCHMQPDKNTSKSFKQFYAVLLEMTAR